MSYIMTETHPNPEILCGGGGHKMSWTKSKKEGYYSVHLVKNPNGTLTVETVEWYWRKTDEPRRRVTKVKLTPEMGAAIKNFLAAQSFTS